MFLEAMDPCKPIVAARPSAVPEVIRHGVLVKPENEGALRKRSKDCMGFKRVRRVLREDNLLCIFLDRVGRHQSPSPFHRHPQNNLWRFGTPGIIIERQVVS